MTTAAARSDPSDPGSGWWLLRSFQGYRAAFIGPDLVAGVTLAAIAVPEQMATAKLGHFAPQIGFYAFLAGTLGFLLFGSNRRMSVGADSTIMPIFAAGLALTASAGGAPYLALAAALGLMVGAIVLAAGLLRMGWIADLLSAPVLTGFLAGIAIHILVSQAPGVMGVAPVTGPLPERVLRLIGEAGGANPWALAIAGAVLAISLIVHAVRPSLPGPLGAMAAAAAAVAILGLESRGVAVIGVVHGGLPSPAFPGASLGSLAGLTPLALIIALVVMVQTAATARSFPPSPDTPPDVARDFVGVGAANLFAGLTQAFPVDASPPRTAIVAQGGARSQLSGLTAMAVVAALLLFGADWLVHVPEAALSGVLLFVASRLVRLADMRAILKASASEFALVVATTAAIVLLPIETGVALGIALSLLQGAWSSARARVLPMHRIPGTTVWWPNTRASDVETVAGVAVVGFQAPLSFLNADSFRRQTLAAASGGVKLLILEAAGVVDIDYTAALAFRTLAADCRDRGVTLAVARLESVRAQTAFARLGLRDLIGADHIFDSVENAVRALQPATSTAPAAG